MSEVKSQHILIFKVTQSQSFSAFLLGFVFGEVLLNMLYMYTYLCETKKLQDQGSVQHMRKCIPFQSVYLSPFSSD